MRTHYITSALAACVLLFALLTVNSLAANKKKCESIAQLPGCCGCLQSLGYSYNIGNNSGETCQPGGDEDDCQPVSKTCYIFSVGWYSAYTNNNCAGTSVHVHHFQPMEYKVTQCD